MDRKTFIINLSRSRRVRSSSYNTREVVQFRGEESLLFQAISPAFYIIRVFGLGPYRFSRERLVPSNVHLIFSFFGVLINSYILIVVVIHFSFVSWSQPVLGITEKGKVFLNYSTSMVNILVAMCTRERLVEVWTMIQDFDYDTNVLGFPQMEDGTKFRVWGIMFLNTLIWVWVNQAGIFAFNETWLQNTSYLILYISTSVYVYKFSGIVIIIGLRFKHLNKIAKTCSPNQSGWHHKPKTESKVIEKLYENLMTASRKLNSIYSWSLLLWLINLCSHVVSNSYFVITSFMDHDFQILVQLCLAGWLVAYILQLVVLHFACDFASKEASRMGHILLNWRRWQTYHNKTEFESTVYLLNYKLNFSAGGCYYVNFPFLRSISGLLTTYLFILLQLRNDK